MYKSTEGVSLKRQGIPLGYTHCNRLSWSPHIVPEFRTVGGIAIAPNTLCQLTPYSSLLPKT